MWNKIVEWLLQEAARQPFKKAGSRLGASLFTDELNGPEWYADRIKRDYRLPEYADAWEMYASDPNYWKRYYHPPPSGPLGKEALVRDSAAHAGVSSRYNTFEHEFPEPDLAPTAGAPSLSPLPPGTSRSSRDVFARESAASAGVPSRFNVFEYGYPEPGAAPSSTIPSGGIGRWWDNVSLPNPLPPPRSSAWNDVFVRNSAAAAGVPSRNNVFEYGYPGPGSVPPPLRTPGATLGGGHVGSAVVPPIPFIPAAPQSAPAGILGLLIEAGLDDPQNPDAPPPGGLVGLIQEYLRSSSRGSN